MFKIMDVMLRILHMKEVTKFSRLVAVQFLSKRTPEA